MAITVQEANTLLNGYLNVLGQRIKRHTQTRTLRGQVDPSGNPFKPLSRGYKAWKDANYGSGKPILQLNGRMINQIAFKINNKTLTVFPTVKYAEKHQFGLEGLPVRRFMDTKGEDQVENKIIDDTLIQFLDKVAERI